VSAEAAHPPLRIRLNGDPRELAAPLTVAELLEAEGLATRPCAVEVNGRLVPKRHHAEHRLAEADVVEIVSLVGGG
jgi:sulfur carrier protein